MAAMISYREAGSVTIVAGDGTSPTLTGLGGSALNGGSGVDLSRSIVLVTTRNVADEPRVRRHIFRAALTSTTNITFYRDQSSFARDCVVEWEVIEFDATYLDSLQTGTVDPTADPTDITVTSVVAAQSVPLVYGQTNSNSLDDGATAQLTSPTNLRLDFAAAPASGEYQASWQLIEFSSDVAVQSGIISISDAQTSNTATITGVNTGRTFVSHGGVQGLASTNTTRRCRATVGLQDATTVIAKRSIEPTRIAGDVAYFAVELPDGAAVEQGEVAIADGNSAPTAQPSFTALTSGAATGWNGWGWQNFRGYDSGETAGTYHDQNMLVSTVLDGTRDGMTIQRGGTSGDVHVGWTAIDWSVASGGSPQTEIIGQPSETDSALGVTASGGAVSVAAGQASETDAALAVSAVAGAASVALGQANETDLAFAVTAIGGAVSVPVARAGETDTALPVTITAGAITVTIGLAGETDAALSVTPTSGTSLAIGIASETDEGRAISPVAGAITVQIGLATEADSALAVTATAGGVVTVGQAGETDAALTITPLGGAVSVGIGQAGETDTAGTVTPGSSLTLTLGRGQEVDAAFGIQIVAGEAIVALGIAAETDVARAITALGGETSADDAKQISLTGRASLTRGLIGYAKPGRTLQ